MREALLQKSAIAVMKLARELMPLKKGDKISTISDYVDKLNISRGTIQNAFSYLKKQEAVILESRGHLGTFIVEIDYKKLWELTGIGLLTGSMPLPYSKLYEGLATGLYKAFAKAGLDFSLAYVRGSKYRIQMLQKGSYSFVITSKLAAKQAMEKGEAVDICIDFGPHTYLSEHVVLFASRDKNRIENGMKVAVDSNSFDQYFITQQICRDKDIELIEMPYNQIVSAISDKRVDAGVWNLDEVKEKKLDLHYQPIDDLTGETTHAVVVVSKENNGIVNILRGILDPVYITNIQKLVVQNQIVPSY